MTQAFNLSQLANFVNSSGKVDVSTGVTGTLPTGNGGTGSDTAPTQGGIAYGTGSAIAYSGAGTSGQVLISNGTGAPTWGTAAAGGLGGIELITAVGTNTWTVPAGITKAIVELYGGGGGGFVGGAARGGAGGYVKVYVTGLVPLSNITVTIGQGGFYWYGSSAATVTPTNTSFGSYATAYAGANWYVSGSYNHNGEDGSGIVNSGTAIRVCKQTVSVSYLGVIPTTPSGQQIAAYDSWQPVGSLGGNVNNKTEGAVVSGAFVPATWTTNSLYAPGARGNGQNYINGYPCGGIGGACLIQY